MVNIKSNYNGDIRRFKLPTSSFDALRNHLSTVYSISDFIVKYKDDEGDLVTLSSSDELSLATASTGDGLLRIQLSHVGDAPAPAASASRSVPAAPAEAPPAAPGPSQAPQPAQPAPGPSQAPPRPSTESPFASMEFTPEQLMSGVAGMFANMFMPGMAPNVPNFPMFGGGGMGRHGHHGHHGRRGMRGRGGRGGFRGRGRGGAGRMGPGGDFLRFFNINQGDIERMIRDFNPESLGTDFCNVQPATLEAMRTLGTSLMQNPGPATVMSAVPAVMPEVRSFIAEVNTGVDLTVERIDAFVQAIRARLNTPLGMENANRVGDFLRTATQDEAVLNLLRRVNGIGANWGNAGSASAERDAQLPITDRLVPQHPLTFGSRGPEVMFLQHILTQLGYMTAADYSMRSGMYGPRTAAAVNRFQSEFNLPVGPYDEVTAASLLSVTETGVPPSASTGSETPAGQPSSSATGGSGNNAPAAA